MVSLSAGLILSFRISWRQRTEEGDIGIREKSDKNWIFGIHLLNENISCWYCRSQMLCRDNTIMENISNRFKKYF